MELKYMNDCRLVEYSPCKVFGIIISAVIGFVAGILSFNAIITVTAGIVWFLVTTVAIGIALLLAAAFIICCCMCDKTAKCFCKNISYLIAGTIGAFLTGILFLLLGAPAGVLGAVVAGVLVFFVGLALTGVVCFLLCICDKDCASNNSSCRTCCCCCTCDCTQSNVCNIDNTDSCKIC